MNIFSPDWTLVWGIFWILWGVGISLSARTAFVNASKEIGTSFFGSVFFGLMQSVIDIIAAIIIGAGLYKVVGVFQ